MSHSASQTAMGAFRAEETEETQETADIGRGRPEGFLEASGAAEAHARVGPTFYEFFAGGGMARAGLGPGWTCLLANDNDQRKGASYASNWTADQLVVGDVGALTTADLPGVADLAWASPPCQDLSLAGDRAGPRRRPLQRVLGLLAAHAGASRRGKRATPDRDRKRCRLADVTWRQGLRRDLRRVGRRRATASARW